MREVSGPIVATSLALIAVFVPVAAMGGITGRLYQQFAITIAVAVAISSINALTLSPALAASLLKPPGEDKSIFDKFFQWFNRWFEIATDKFMVLTGFFTHKISRAAILLVALVAGIVLLFRIVPAGFVPEEDQAYIMAGVIMPDSASLQRTDAVMSQVEDILAEYDAVQNASVIAGYSILSGTLQPNAGMAFIQLKDWDERADAADHATEWCGA